MTQEEEVKDSFIYHKWYEKNDSNEYTISVEYKDMITWGFGNLFVSDNIDDYILPIQYIKFYCLNQLPLPKGRGLLNEQ